MSETKQPYDGRMPLRAGFTPADVRLRFNALNAGLDSHYERTGAWDEAVIAWYIANEATAAVSHASALPVFPGDAVDRLRELGRQLEPICPCPICSEKASQIRADVAAIAEAVDQGRQDRERLQFVLREAVLAVEDDGEYLCLWPNSSDENCRPIATVATANNLENNEDEPFGRDDVPFLTEDQRADINGSKVSATGNVRDFDTIVRAVDFLLESA